MEDENISFFVKNFFGCKQSAPTGHKRICFLKFNVLSLINKTMTGDLDYYPYINK